jgi:hypothetical protein
MSQEQDNSAFPLHMHGDYGKGMTMRDYFAAAALTGILANHPANEIVEIGCIRSKPGAIIVASWIIADAMLKARKEAND